MLELETKGAYMVLLCVGSVFFIQFLFKTLIYCEIVIVSYFRTTDSCNCGDDTGQPNTHYSFTWVQVWEKKNPKTFRQQEPISWNVCTSTGERLTAPAAPSWCSPFPKLPVDSWDNSPNQTHKCLLEYTSLPFASLRFLRVRLCAQAGISSVGLGCEVLLCTCALTELPLAPWMELNGAF